MRPLLPLSAIVLLAALSGCGVAKDMRAEYLADRALGDATAELYGPAPHRQQVVADLDLAYRLRAGEARFAARLAPLYLDAGQYRKALECFETASRTTGEPYDFEKAMCRVRLGEVDQALPALRQALADAGRRCAAGRMSAPEYANLLNNAGYTLVDARVRVDLASAWIAEAVELAPLMAIYVDSLGWAYYRQGRYQDAAFYLERAARLEAQSNAEMVWHLGAVHARLGQYRRATGELLLAIRLDPTNLEARDTLRRLQHELPAPARA